MKADKELVTKLKALKRSWLIRSTEEMQHADTLYHECSSSEMGGKCRGKQKVHEECAQQLKELLESVEIES